ncbi:MAG: AbiV family abortive infection protein [Thermotogota bacterium]|nr:AbiV family abortive infection protein [Thermotogota bacterium]
MNINYKIKPPQARSELYKNIFENKNEIIIIQLISDGLIALINNASRLIKDVDLLIASNRYASARFLLATADEEMAKSYILLDMCRLDFIKYESVLRCLCRAFYDHVLKHAYTSIHRFGRIRDLKHAREIYEVEITKWWPNNDPESGEPDMPHDTYFSREMPLYVDYIDYDQKWSIPSNDSEALYFKKLIGLDPLSVSKKYLEILKFTYTAGFFKLQSLTILHDIFKKYYIKENLKKNELMEIYHKIDEKINSEFSIPKETIFKTIYFSWPIYDFLTR